MNHIETFISITSSSSEDAKKYLELANGNIDDAVSLYFEREDVREADPQVLSRLNDSLSVENESESNIYEDDSISTLTEELPSTPPPAPFLEPLPEYIPFEYQQQKNKDNNDEVLYSSKTRVQIRYPDGTKKVKTLLRTDTVSTLFSLIANDLLVYLSTDPNYSETCGYSSFESTYQLVKIQGMQVIEPSNNTLEEEHLREHSFIVRYIPQ